MNPWWNKQYSELMKKAERESDNQTRLNYFSQAEEILLNNSPIIPIYHYAKKNLVSKYVKGWHTNILGNHPYKYLSLSEE